VLPGIIGVIQATEILKLALGAGVSLMGRLLLFDALEMKFREIKVRRDPQCPLCGDHPTITSLIDYEHFCGRNDVNENRMTRPDEVTVQDMKAALKDPAKRIQVIDVREPDEQQIARIEGVPLMPLSTFADRFAELDPAREYYIHCKAGVRSMKVVQFLKEQGFKSVKSVQGGILAWSDQIDPAVPKY
jgi:adenylyltransferase/sulfurtransferase